MTLHSHHRRVATALSIALVATGVSQPALAHEAWLLTPAEIEALVAEPMPALFTNHFWMGLAALLGGAAALIALGLEDRLKSLEKRLFAPAARLAVACGAPTLRLGLAVMLVLAALGGLPRHGTAAWIEPTLFVPDMQLGTVPGWEWLVPAQMLIALLLATGFLTRLAGAALIALAAVGLGVFGTVFLSYAPHFAAPGLMLVLAGGGAFSVDNLLEGPGRTDWSEDMTRIGWRVAQILVGGGFVYLAVAYKLTQPTLLIAILEHGEVPTFGLPYAVIALAMTGVELICGTMLIFGRLTRPVALAIIAAITFLAVALGETPLFHANLYGVMIFLALSGRVLPAGDPVRLNVRGFA